jgi:hypothetical protein
LWILCELDEFVDPIEVKAELTQRTGLSNYKRDKERIDERDLMVYMSK